jgi:hypothetical protein
MYGATTPLLQIPSLDLRPSQSLRLCGAPPIVKGWGGVDFKFLIKNILYVNCSSLGERDHWGDPDVDGRIILRGILRTWEGIVGTGWSGLRIGTGGGHL